MGPGSLDPAWLKCPFHFTAFLLSFPVTLFFNGFFESVLCYSTTIDPYIHIRFRLSRLKIATSGLIFKNVELLHVEFLVGINDHLFACDLLE